MVAVWGRIGVEGEARVTLDEKRQKKYLKRRTMYCSTGKGGKSKQKTTPTGTTKVQSLVNVLELFLRKFV
jgi:hypothetical protein